MKTGIELIEDERNSHFSEHGYTLEHDAELSSNKQLSYAALMLLNVDYQEGIDSKEFPEGWHEQACERMISKSYKDRLIIAGFLIAAELDRINLS